MIKNIFNWKIALLGIIILAAILRFWQLGEVPKGFHGDEASYGYNSYSILLTGRDEHGKTLPLILKSWGEYKPALYSYLAIPFIAILDLNPLSVRIVSAIFGIFTVILMYFLVYKLFNLKKAALVASLLLAISPWHLTLSRTVSEVVISTFFIILLIYAGIYLKEKFNKWWLLIAVTSGIFAMWSYTASRFFVILISGLLILFSTKIIHKKIKINLTLLFLCILFIAIGVFASFIDNTTRFNQVSILSTPETKLTLEEQIREDRFSPSLVTRIFHNKVVNYSRTVAKNYSAYFTADFLFLNGGYPFRVKIPDSGLFYFWQIPFLLIGVYLILLKRTKWHLFLLAWWAILLLPAALTFDEIPNIYRSLVVLPPIIIIATYGVYKFFFSSPFSEYFIRISLILVIVIAIWEFCYFQHQYYIHQEVHRPWYREYAYEPLTKTLSELSPNYKKIVITKTYGGPYISLLFWSKYDPNTYQSEGSSMNDDYTGFGKYYFVPQDCTYDKETGVLFVNKAGCPTPQNFKLLRTIYWQDNNPAFKIFEYVPTK